MVSPSPSCHLPPAEAAARAVSMPYIIPLPTQVPCCCWTLNFSRPTPPHADLPFYFTLFFYTLLPLYYPYYYMIIFPIIYPYLLFLCVLYLLLDVVATLLFCVWVRSFYAHHLPALLHARTHLPAFSHVYYLPSALFKFCVLYLFQFCHYTYTDFPFFVGGRCLYR